MNRRQFARRPARTAALRRGHERAERARFLAAWAGSGGLGNVLRMLEEPMRMRVERHRARIAAEWAAVFRYGLQAFPTDSAGLQGSRITSAIVDEVPVWVRSSDGMVSRVPDAL